MADLSNHILAYAALASAHAAATQATAAWYRNWHDAQQDEQQNTTQIVSDV
jgi:hypothetical protein